MKAMTSAQPLKIFSVGSLNSSRRRRASGARHSSPKKEHASILTPSQSRGTIELKDDAIFSSSLHYNATFHRRDYIFLSFNFIVGRSPGDIESQLLTLV